MAAKEPEAILMETAQAIDPRAPEAIPYEAIPARVTELREGNVALTARLRDTARAIDPDDLGSIPQETIPARVAELRLAHEVLTERLREKRSAGELATLRIMHFPLLGWDDYLTAIRATGFSGTDVEERIRVENFLREAERLRDFGMLRMENV